MARIAVLALLCAPPAAAASRQVEVGLENFYYRTADAPLNRGNLLHLRPDEDLLRGTLSWRESRGPLRLVLRGFVERRLGEEGTEWTAREAYLQYGWGEGLSVRVGKQRTAWGSGFAWNPTSRLEPPRNPLNPGLEQEGAEAVRLDVIPTAWAGIILVAARSEARVGDLPFDTRPAERRTAAVRVRFLIKDTDLALVSSGGKGQRSLLGFDVGRAHGSAALHAEGAFYRGAEMPPTRARDTFFRLALGLLYTRGSATSLSLEYFFNEEGYDGPQRDAYLAGLEAAAARAEDPGRPPPARAAALAEYMARAAVPYAGGLGLRRHYLHATWTRATAGGKWGLAARAVVGLADGGFALTPGISYAPRGNLTLNLDAVLLAGSPRSEYQLTPVRGAVQSRMKVAF